MADQPKRTDQGERLKISVVTVVKHIDETFDVTLNSIASQDCSSFEWIVKSADEIPPDRGKQIAACARHVRLLEGKDNGIYDAMNQALAHATGEYVIFLNSGDTFFSNDTLTHVAESISGASPNLLYGAYEIDGEMVFYPDHLSNFFFLRTALCHQAYFLKTELLRGANGFDLHYEVLADHEVALRLRAQLLASHQRTDFPITRLPPMGFSARQREKKEAERKRLEGQYFPWRSTWPLRLLLLSTLRPVRLFFLRSSGVKRMRSMVLKLVYRSH